MSITGLAIIYIITWWIVFFAILPIDVNRTKTVKIDGEDPGSPENPKMLKKVPLLYRNYYCYFYNNLSINKI
jgi:predicted secreted protein